MIKFDNYREIFASDGGALLDIRVFDTTAEDWDTFLDYVRSHYRVLYLEDGHPKSIPKFELIRESYKSASLNLQISLDGITLNCSAFEATQVEIDLLPEDVNTRQKAESVFEFMISLARLFHKDVFLTREFVSATRTELQNSALCSVDHQTGSIHMRV